nr:unnamed protein product [Spirometra erinaceieuropaei]
MEERFGSICEEKINLEKSILDTNTKLTASENQCIHLEAELRLSQGLVQDLQTKVSQNSQISSQLESVKMQLEDSIGTVGSQQKQIVELSSRCSSQETSLTEMAHKVESAKLEAERLRERLQALSMAEWKSDADTGVCTQCSAPFGLSRRKHHCRNCGLIFCYECSAYRMTLPSSSKPLRVCEPCHNQLLERYSTTTK